MRPANSPAWTRSQKRYFAIALSILLVGVGLKRVRLWISRIRGRLLGGEFR